MRLSTALRFGLRMVSRDPGRLARTGAGLAVAVLIILIEVSFWTSVSDAHLRIVDASKADLFLLDLRRWHLNKWDRMLATHVNRARGIEGVEAIVPVYQAGMNMRTEPEGAPKRIIGVGFEPEAAPLAVGMSETTARLLNEPGAVVYDSGSRAAIFGQVRRGQQVLVDGHRMKVVGTALLGPNLVNDGNLIMSDGNFLRLLPGSSPIMALVRLKPGADIQDVQIRLNEALAPEVQVYTRSQLNWRETRYLGQVAPTGILFGAGMIAGLIVGAVICYQSFFMTVRRQGKAYATLSAMGASPGAIALSVIAQAVVMSAVAFLMAWAVAETVTWWLRASLSVPASLKADILVWVAVSVVVMCVVSAWLALRNAAFRHAEQLY